MEMRLCPNNHYFDKTLHGACPHCVGGAYIGETVADVDANQAGIGKTVPVGAVAGRQYGAGMRADMEPNGAGRRAAVEPNGAGMRAAVEPNGAGMRADAAIDAAAMDGEQTRAIAQYEIGLEPVVGWLVCVEGKNKGRDYRIHAENNFIGRDLGMDIAISDDEAVSRHNHAIVSYDTRDNAYYFAQGTGRSIVRVNGKAMLSTAQLAANDQIEIGGTKLVFVPLRGEGFDWLATG